MLAYVPFVADVEALAARCLSGAERARDDLPELNGLAYRRLRELVGIDDLRAHGAFFTGEPLARQVVEPLRANIQAESVIVDPTCGAGDLLLAAARLLPTRENLQDTLAAWGCNLRGADTQSTFVRLARCRLILLACARFPGQRVDAPSTSLFPHLVVQDGTQFLAVHGSAATHVLLNPPYTINRASSPDWAAGGISNAALFTAWSIDATPTGTLVCAVLPDVLRTGTRYSRWREYVSARVTDPSQEVYGLFDNHTDVDVFILRGRTEAASEKKYLWTEEPSQAWRAVADDFAVAVGTVVPHRDPDRGEARPFLTAKTVPGNSVHTEHKLLRRHMGKSFKPPFVVLRRTSRPGSGIRLTPTVVTGDAEVFVENHLIVVIPRTSGLKACEELAHELRSDRITAWMDQRIRCRHLTVQAVREIPWRRSAYGD